MQGYIYQNFWTRIECERTVREYFMASYKPLVVKILSCCPIGSVQTPVRNVMTLYSGVNASITIQTDFKYEVDPTYPLHNLNPSLDCLNCVLSNFMIWHDGYFSFCLGSETKLALLRVCEHDTPMS